MCMHVCVCICPDVDIPNIFGVLLCAVIIIIMLCTLLIIISALLPFTNLHLHGGRSWQGFKSQEIVYIEVISGTNGSESLCREGAKTRWRLQWMY